VFYVQDLGPLTIPPSDYLFNSSGRYIMNIHFSGSMILGTTFIRAFRIALDRDRQRIGFAATSTCPGSISLSVSLIFTQYLLS
jgi:hypothetical protein